MDITVNTNDYDFDVTGNTINVSSSVNEVTVVVSSLSPSAQGINIIGEVATVADLPDPYSGQLDDGYVVVATGDLYAVKQLNPTVWSRISRFV